MKKRKETNPRQTPAEMASKTLSTMEKRIPSHCTLWRCKEFGITEEPHEGPPRPLERGSCRSPQGATRTGALSATTHRDSRLQEFQVPFTRELRLGWQASTWTPRGPKLARAGVRSRQSVASSASPGRGGERGHQSEPPENRLSAARRPPRSRPARETSSSDGRGAGRPAVVGVAPLPSPPARVPGPPGLASASPSGPAPTPVAPRREATLLARPAAPGDRARERPSRTRPNTASPAPRARLDAREFSLKFTWRSSRWKSSPAATAAAATAAAATEAATAFLPASPPRPPRACAQRPLPTNNRKNHRGTRTVGEEGPGERDHRDGCLAGLHPGSTTAEPWLLLAVGRQKNSWTTGSL
jgi:hypothetical protein